MHEREEIIRQTLKALGFPHGHQLYEALKPRYFWMGMRKDCICLSTRSKPRQLESAKFPRPPFLLPCEKGEEPFLIWALDNIVRISPASPSGARDVIVAICVFCKWVELGLLKDLSSASVRDWFHENIVCRYGVPAAVRCDRGAEFRGEFESYCKRNGIQIRRIATRNPRANGQIERYN